jgi:hypothetical protein
VWVTSTRGSSDSVFIDAPIHRRLKRLRNHPRGDRVIPLCVLIDPPLERRLEPIPLELRFRPALPPILRLGLISFIPFEVSLILGFLTVIDFFLRLLGIIHLFTAAGCFLPAIAICPSSIQ